ncbi:MAG: helix-turn-helix transcriptional regulator [Gemmatimonadota bacterium]|jgi:DNA-binding PadR family transcriptional regulator
MTQLADVADPRSFLPLTDLAFSILVALTDEELHGYRLIKELRRRPGREKLRTGTVYAALARLRDDGLVQETPGPAGGNDDERRRYYTATSLGVSAARAEAARLGELLGLARAKRLTPGRA